MYKILMKDPDGYMLTRVLRVPLGEPDEIVGLSVRGFEAYNIQDIIIRCPLKSNYVVYEVEVGTEVDSFYDPVTFIRELSRDEFIERLNEYGKSIDTFLINICNPIHPLLVEPTLTKEQQLSLLNEWKASYVDLRYKTWYDLFISVWILVGNDLLVKTHTYIPFESLLITLWAYVISNITTSPYSKICQPVKTLWEGGCLPFKASTGWYIVTKNERWLIEDENTRRKSIW